MDSFISKQSIYPKKIILTGVVLLLLGMLFGIFGALQYVIPRFLKEEISFEKMRPLHVSSALFWIILTAIGVLLTYLQVHTGKKIFSNLFTIIQFYLFVLAIVLIFICYLAGIFGGREYWEYPPKISILIVAGWVLLLINYIKSINSLINQPVYIWMWLTGIVFFLFTFSESYLWLLPYFKRNIINDMTIQWKSYGSMVGAWNMLIYGSAVFLMSKISNNKAAAYSKTAFTLYFIGLFNLMFNWGHHIYTLPTHQYIRVVSYAVSMTELLLLGHIIYDWKKHLTVSQKFNSILSFRFLLAADTWIFLNLVLAIGMSIPAINLYTHGTHITVAHAMGTTIGINSMLLIAFVVDILYANQQKNKPIKKWVTIGFWISNASLLIFWLALIISGAIKAKWQMSAEPEVFSVMMLQLRPFFVVFLFSGTTLAFGLCLILIPLLKIKQNAKSY